ncbi:BTB/POZ and MATH domain-containing protein 1 [Brachypodium distachyon]|uniref:BTB domain-containing protein n=1 Tax=Brachypodium distachyon TaxID=15368 RepID=A0A2K2CQW3_BRADI|nr:BTB/POZ and MATH domain-containing protein 1 [Brachypodium distachyon]PNT64414.1 hypothetical protein BRADI_4g28305v3 [Brachypodium distachyon]|eukprot:XP_003576435.1 BTB/POZ and MATH domain-containing protein 1 [Brachypodium distachyon]
MAEGKSHGCDIIPTKDTHLFHLRVRFSEPKDTHTFVPIVSPVAAAYDCEVIYMTAASGQMQMRFSLAACYDLNLVLDGAAQVIPHMVFLDKRGSPAPSVGTARPVQSSYSETMIRCYNLDAERDEVEANCVVDDHFVVLCSIEVIRDGATSASWTEKEKELPDLGYDLAMMSHKQELADVVFDVDGESFDAHRLVLAARSPVFRAELYGPMTESKMPSITIQDMGASTFRSMLHYLYHGSLPKSGKADVSSTMTEYQHLLVAADRYGIERLKKICEDELCVSRDSITIDNVVSMLELAEVHICPTLKARCLDFLVDGENFKMVGTSCEYLHLMQALPSLLVEVRNRFKIAHERVMKPGAHKKSRIC